ncbi:MAG TPA: IPT/TIG domain-containing protein [Desertimonas sp.]|nr:IPT/TIG domain-containing protein [Desertimonas sp.]
MPGPTPTMPPSQGYPGGTYPTAGTWGYPVTPAVGATGGHPTPSVSAVSPTSKSINTGTFDMVVRGSGFTGNSQITLATVAQPTNVLDASTLVTPQTSQGKTAAPVAVTVSTGGVLASPGATFTYNP